MCGNGARCVGFLAYNQNWITHNHFSLETDEGLHELTVLDHDVQLDFPPPSEYQLDVGILRESRWREGGVINTGVPHYVLFVDDVDSILVDEVGPYYRNHKKFACGINVNFAEKMSVDTLKVRTYERGVERETLSCGTGSVASALLASKHLDCSSPITILTRGGTLDVSFDNDWSSISLTGAVKLIYEGIIEILF